MGGLCDSLHACYRLSPVAFLGQSIDKGAKEQIHCTSRFWLRLTLWTKCFIL